ncbi:hypothetical protein RHGRI_012615 [Rhododendron griersonianum]|uniref:Uncharacterized protein n=1 Tax=Rhododendron griersonianum TaxID=479676 RepID=A0AAV6KS96_9ERIC|nr:hypothetical protein RHGRI_012615 [Rhododendron griersonianum]
MTLRKQLEKCPHFIKPQVELSELSIQIYSSRAMIEQSGSIRKDESHTVKRQNFHLLSSLRAIDMVPDN